jgi:metal-responsive CopG/Arc/MetJ family transcriptional regulator
MRTTVTLDDDVTAAVDRLRRERSIGVSEAVNELVRAGLAVRRSPERFRQTSARLGLRIDVANVAEALEILEGSSAR